MMISHSPSIVGFAFAALVCISGCTTKRTASGERLYFTQTAAYDRKVRTFALTEQQARDRVAEFVRTERGFLVTFSGSVARQGEFSCDEVEHGRHVLDGTVATGSALHGGE